MIRQLAVFIASLAVSSAVLGADSHGFRVSDPRNALTAEAQASLDEQLQIVESAGLPPAVLDTLRQTPIVIDPGLRGQPGIFSVRGGEGIVLVRPIQFPPNKPILLHELLHAYDFKVLHMDDPKVAATYRRVKDSDLFPAQFQSSHFLANAKEFFAVTGTLYLFGDIQQPPFSCASLARLGQDYLDFLAAQFGPHSCKAG
jgi:hypothetical protein